MRQNQLNREIAAATGESIREISRRGFVPLSSIPVEREPEDLIVDWDELEGSRFTGMTVIHRGQAAVA